MGFSDEEAQVSTLLRVISVKDIGISAVVGDVDFIGWEAIGWGVMGKDHVLDFNLLVYPLLVSHLPEGSGIGKEGVLKCFPWLLDPIEPWVPAPLGKRVLSEVGAIQHPGDFTRGAGVSEYSVVE